MAENFDVKTITDNNKTIDVTLVKSSKKSPLEHHNEWAPGCDQAVYERVQQIVKDIESGKEEKCLEYCQKLDNWPAESKTILLTKEEVVEQISSEFVSQETKDDIQIQLKRVTEFAKAQKAACQEFEIELGEGSGIVTGQKLIPMSTVGCYVPGGRYSHISSATMTIATAKAAGVKNIVAASPPMRGTNKIQPATLYAMHAAGADHILCCGGAHAIAAMTFGCFTGRPADMIVGPGNSYVAEAKRYLYGRIGIDMFAGPTEILILADHKADPRIIAQDLISQAEHGPTSPAWLITTDLEVAKKVKELCPILAKALPEDNIARQSWEEYGEILYVAGGRDDMAALSDRYAAEHLEVQCENLNWWLENLVNYGSLFLGEETCVTYGDKISGPNHALPTLRASRYTGGLSVDKYVKKLTYQKSTKEGNRLMGPLAARISRAEGMEGHARAGDDRMAKYFPDEKFNLGKTDYVAKEVAWTCQ